MKTLLLGMLLVAPMMAWANPAPFGLELGTATVKAVQSKYQLTSAGTNAYSKGPMYDMDTSQLHFEGLQAIKLVFGSEGKLQAVLATFGKYKFDELLKMLGGKYKLVSKQIPFVGNKSARFVDGDTDIILSAPHMSFKLTLNYVQDSLLKKFNKQSDTEQRHKKSHEKSLL